MRFAPFVVICVLCASARAEPKLATRAGWAYGLGLEVEYRPRSWGVGVGGGYVPTIGVGGYAGVQWGQRPLAESGLVAEAGIFRGVKNEIRVADTGFGPYVLAGYTLARERWSGRFVVGGGLPVGDEDHPFAPELLAKLTFGVHW